MKMKKFLTVSMVFLGLFAGVNTWAQDADPETDYYWARLTAKPAVTTIGSGKVFVSDVGNAPVDGDYQAVSSSADGCSQIFLMSSILNSNVSFYAWAKPDAGSYFTGWSFTDGYTDLGDGEGSSLRVDVMPSSKRGHANVREHFVYAAFEPIKIVSYEIVSGSNNTTSWNGENWTCTQTVRFRAETPGAYGLSNITDVRHFKLPVLARKEGTSGTWTTSVAEWVPSSNISIYGQYAELNVPVTFTAPNGDAAEYGATLTLETYAGVKMNVYLSARTVVAGEEAVRYNKSKVLQESGNLTDLLANAVAGDIIKLNGDYGSSVSINKDITFDLNGYTLSNTLTVSGGNVTLAYSPFGGSVNSMIVSGGKAVLNGGTIGGLLTISSGATVEQNGATIGSINNNGSLTTTDGKIQGALTSSKTLIINGGSFVNESGVAIVVTGGTAQIKKGTISGAQYGVQTTGGATTIEKLAVVRGGIKALHGNGGSLTVNNGKFTNPDDLIAGTVTFNAGFFQTATGPTALGKQVWRNTAGVEFREGYEFFVGNQETAQASNVSVCRIGQTSYSSLEDALAFANNSGKEVFIIMENDYTLKAGYYTLPANATLIVPMSNDQDVPNPIVPRSSGLANPVSFRKLIFADGVNMTLAGTIELTCTQYGSGETMGVPGGNYGHLIMKPGSHMTINNGGELRAWGFVTGDGTKDANGTYLSGEIDARRGGIVREMFQMGDWKGGDISFTMIMDQAPQNMTHLFPVYMYFIQNVESPVKYHPGSSLICATSVNVSGSINAYANDIKVVGKEGEPAMFLMDEMADAENTWVRKWYDAAKDQQVYEVNSGAKLGSLVVDLGEVPGAMFGGSGMFAIQLDSRKFVLPLTSNFKIHLLSGNMQFTQSTSCLPGMEVEVDKESEISIIPNEDPNTLSGALYFYDADQWSFMNMGLGGYVGNSGKYGAIVRYSATWDIAPDKSVTKPNVRDISSPAAIGDAKLIVHGTFRSASGCSVYTTWTKGTGDTMEDNPFVINPAGTGGASVISSNEDAGTFIFDDDSPAFDGVHWDDPANFGDLEHLVGFGNSVLVNYDHNNYSTYGISGYPIYNSTVLKPTEYVPMFGYELCTPAMLKNGDGTFAVTEGSLAGTSYCYMNNRWTSMKVAEENECFMIDNYGTFYAKPAEYVAVSATVNGVGDIVGNDDHTYSDAAGAGRLFILMDDCQWWEVEKKDNLYHCIHPNNDTYYYWDDGEGMWLEQRFTITWRNWDGEEIKSYTYDPNTGDPQEVQYSVTYGTMAEYLGTNPTRDANIDYTYDFTGWSPALGPVTNDITYTATFAEQPRKYTIIFTNEGGDEIERQFLKHNDVPVCENTPTRTGFTLQWEPEIAAVVGDATYRATWLENPPIEYQVTFFDYNGTTVLQQGPVAVGTMPTPPSNPANKPATTEFTYVFDHWSPAPEIVSATSVKSYTAVYSEVAKTYTVRFYEEDGTTQIGEAQSLTYGAMPVAPAATKQNPQTGYSYTYVWQNKADATKAIETVKEDVDYKAVFTGTPNKYLVTVKSNPSGACSFTGAGMYDYNTSVTITLAVNSGYTFTGWSDGLEGTNTTRTITVTEDKELVANFNVLEPDYTITWKNEDGSANLVSPVGQKAGTATTYTGAIPTKAASAEWTYTFDGWATEANGDRVYKNGLTPVATADATYYAHFDKKKSQYTISWRNEAGTVDIEVDYDQPYGAAIAFNSATPTKTATEQYTFTFDGWSASVGGNVADLPATVSGDAAFYAHFSSTTKTYLITWLDDEDNLIDQTMVAYGVVPTHADPVKAATPEYIYTFNGWDVDPVAVTGQATYRATFTATPNITDLEIGIGDTEDLGGVPTTKRNLVITSNGSASGQLTGASNLVVTGEVIFRIEQDFDAQTWYAVAVPWTVDINTGIYNGAGTRLGVGPVYVIEFDQNAYASADRDNTVDYWTFLDLTGNDMQPGKLYMVYLASAQTALEFHKKDGAPLLTNSTAVTLASGSVPQQQNWNAIANPALFYATLDAGVEYNDGQRFVPSTGAYVADKTEAMIVGEPMFVQVSAPSTVVAQPMGGGAGMPAYYRMQSFDTNAENRFVVEISNNGQMNDRLIAQTTEEKADEYVIGKDMAKMGISTKVAQMWIERYDANLCKNTVKWIGGNVEYPLSLFAPATGEYILSAAQEDGDATLYLTRNGQAIWNLSDGNYVLTLESGTTYEYGLRACAKAPQVTTAIDEAVVDNKNVTATKVLINDQVFIIRGGEVYTIEGQLVK